jgi:hypothetical protein
MLTKPFWRRLFKALANTEFSNVAIVFKFENLAAALRLTRTTKPASPWLAGGYGYPCEPHLALGFSSNRQRLLLGNS